MKIYKVTFTAVWTYALWISYWKTKKVI